MDGSGDVLRFPHLCPRQQSYWKNKSNKRLRDVRRLHQLVPPPKSKRAGRRLEGPRWQGLGATAPVEHLSCPSAGSPAPLRMAASPRGPGVSALHASGHGWWAAAFPGDGPRAEDVLPVPSSPGFPGCCGREAPSILLKSTSSGAAKHILPITCGARFPERF